LERLVEHQKEQRKSRRFALRQPAVIRCHDGTSHQLIAETQNASLHGVLLAMSETVASDSRVEVEVQLSRDGIHNVLLRGEGRVVRSEITLGGGYGIAVAFDQPLSERAHHAAQTTKPSSQQAAAARERSDPKGR
jgi:hypothetical protein